MQSLFRLAGTYPLHAALIASLCISGWLWHGWNGAIADRDAIRLDLDAIKASQVVAARNARIAHDAEEARLRALAERTDNEATRLRADYARLADRYVTANRMLKAAGSASSRTDAAGESDSAGFFERASAKAVLVAITGDDLRICTDNTARLEAAQSWALELAD